MAFEKNKLIVLDPTGAMNAQPFKEILGGSWGITPYECVRQRDGCDSGVHLLMNAEAILYGQHPASLHSPKTMKYYRRHISHTLLNAAIDNGTVIS